MNSLNLNFNDENILNRKNNNYHLTIDSYKEEIEQKNLNLRKQHIKNYIIKKRIIKNNFNKDDNLILELSDLEKNLPNELTKEFDIYEGKLDVINQFLNNNFSLLDNLTFNKNDVIKYSLVKLRNLSIEENFNNLIIENKKIIDSIFNSLLTILFNSYNSQILYEITFILINFTVEKKYSIKLERIDVWKKLYEIFYLYKNYYLNSNILWLFRNIIFEDSIALYIFKEIEFKKMFNDFLNFCCNNLNIINYEDLTQIILLIKECINYNKSRFVYEMNFCYNNLIKLFLNISGLINQDYINKTSFNNKINIINFLENTINIFSLILRNSAENYNEIKENNKNNNIDYLNYFYSESFLINFTILLKQLINKPILYDNDDLCISLYIEIYNFIGISLSTELFINDLKIYKNNGYISITEFIVQNFENNYNNDDLLKKIIFSLSNYVFISEEFCNDIIKSNIIENLYKYINKFENNEILVLKECYYLFNNLYYKGNQLFKNKENYGVLQIVIEIIVIILTEYLNGFEEKKLINIYFKCINLLNELIKYIKNLENIDDNDEIKSLLNHILIFMENKGIKDTFEKIENEYDDLNITNLINYIKLQI